MTLYGFEFEKIRAVLIGDTWYKVDSFAMADHSRGIFEIVSNNDTMRGPTDVIQAVIGGT